MKALVSSAERIKKLNHGKLDGVSICCIDGPGGDLSWDDLEEFSDGDFNSPSISDDDLAYILYTSGSTGTPKGVCISNVNALDFINWAVDEVRADANDHFSNHAPFHFDLSVFDIYGAFSVGATLHIIPEMMSYVPKKLVEFINAERITIWYSVPSALILMMEQGDLLADSNIALKTIIFAGEPFPIKPLKKLFDHFPSINFYNFYGPTETNVCTYYKVEEISEDRMMPVPIGKECSGDQVYAVKDDGAIVQPGETGELMVKGPTVMLGYWGKPPHGDKPYATGDLVRLLPDGNYEYMGRRDHMVKVRGHRIELGEIEAALERHPHIQSSAVIVQGHDVAARIVAFVVLKDSKELNLIDVKKHCAENLPRYMIVDKLFPLDQLPRTGNGKVDRIKLGELCGSKSL
jgi:amino acid adenylation domain-containing protein